MTTKNKLISVVEDYAHDYGEDALLEELFPHLSIGEIVWEMYEYGMIPEDVLEEFLNDE